MTVVTFIVHVPTSPIPCLPGCPDKTSLSWERMEVTSIRPREEFGPCSYFPHLTVGNPKPRAGRTSPGSAQQSWGLIIYAADLCFKVVSSLHFMAKSHLFYRRKDPRPRGVI